MAKKIDKDAKKREIALKALDVFAQKGLHCSSVEEIAKVAGVAKGTIYLYFANKDEIALEIWESFMDEHEKWLEANLPLCTNESQKIVKYLYFGHFEDALLDKLRTLYGGYIASCVVDANPLLREFANGKFELHLKQIKGFLQSGIEKGEFIDIDVEITAEIIIQLKNGSLVSATERGLGTEHLRNRIPTLIGHFLNTIQKERKDV